VWGVWRRDAGTGFAQKVADGATGMLPCGVWAPRTGHLESLKSVADPTDRPSSPTPPEQSVSPPSRRIPIPLCFWLSPEPSTLMADDDNPGPALPVLNTTVLSSTEHLAIVWTFSFFSASRPWVSLVLGCGGLADGLSRILISTMMTMTPLLGEV
jgi:hypothetical protein